jgi:RNA polymerase sigma-70 factor (ECF subfamily)
MFMTPTTSADLPQNSIALVTRTRSGERQAEDELVERYSRGLSIIRRTVSDPFAVDDIRQETFRIALEKIRKGDAQEPAKLSGFICSLARNLVIDHFRRTSRFNSREDLDVARPLKDPRPSQLEQLLQEEKLRIVRKVLAELASDRDQQMLYRFYIAEEDKNRICRNLGLTSLHFNRVLFRARERYEELYQEAVRKK